MRNLSPHKNYIIQNRTTESLWKYIEFLCIKFILTGLLYLSRGKYFSKKNLPLLGGFCAHEHLPSLLNVYNDKLNRFGSKTGDHRKYSIKPEYLLSRVIIRSGLRHFCRDEE